MTLVLEFGFVVSSVTDKVREKVISSVEALLELDVTAVDILVDDIHVEDDGPVGDDVAARPRYEHAPTEGRRRSASRRRRYAVGGTVGRPYPDWLLERAWLSGGLTGGARGIGLATARAFASAGARVVIGDIDVDARRERRRRRSAAWRSRSTCATPTPARRSSAAVGDVDVLVNNAGVAYGGAFLDTPPEMRDLQLDVNLRGVINGMGAVLPGMVARGRGHVVNVASLAGRIATPNAADLHRHEVRGGRPDRGGAGRAARFGGTRVRGAAHVRADRDDRGPAADRASRRSTAERCGPGDPAGGAARRPGRCDRCRAGWAVCRGSPRSPRRRCSRLLRHGATRDFEHPSGASRGLHRAATAA